MNTLLEYFWLLLGCLLTWIWVDALANKRWAHLFTDIPNSRSSHTKTTPRGAGFAFAISVLSASLLTKTYIFISICAFLLAVVGLFDDIYSIKAKWRFATQFGIAAAATAQIFPGLEQALPAHISLCILTLLVMLSSINFYNFADGINGHAAIQFMITLISWLLISNSRDTWVLNFNNSIFLTLLGSLIYFLYANLKLKSVFMGDSGSTFLGFLSATFPFAMLSEGADLHCYLLCLLSVLIFSYVIFLDCASIVVIKISIGVSPSHPHRNHLYQRLSRQPGWNHTLVSIILGLVQALLSFSYIASIFIAMEFFYVTIIIGLFYSAVVIRNSLQTRKVFQLEAI